MATQQKLIPGKLLVRQSGGAAGSDELSFSHDGTNGTVETLGGELILGNSTRNLTLGSSSLTPNGGGVLALGDATNYFTQTHTASITAPSALTLSTGNGVVVGSATGGGQGSGSLNVESLFVNGTSVTAGVSSLNDLSDVAITSLASGNILYYDGTNFVNEATGSTSGVQAWNQQLDDISALAVTDGNIIVGDGTTFVAESGNTARTSIGLGTGDDVTFNSLTTTTIDRGGAGTASLFTDAGGNDITVGGSTSTVVIAGDLQVDGTTTTVNSSTLDVADKNITVNDGGATSTSVGAGLNIEGDSAAVVGYLRVNDTDNSLLEFKAPTGNILTLDVNDDVEIEVNTPTTDEVLQYDGTKFVNTLLNLTNDFNDLTDVTLTTETTGDIVYFDGSVWVNAGPGSTSGVQAWNQQLDDISALSVTDGNIIVGDGTTFVAESGNTARTSIGLGSGDDVDHHSVNLVRSSATLQSVQTVAYNTTTDATTTELFVDGSSERLVLPNDTTWGYEIKLVARRTDVDGESAAYNIKGAIDRNATAGSTALIGVNEVTSNEDTAAWDVSVDADTTNGSLRIQVTGEASKVIKWIAFVNYVEVIG